VFGGMMMEEEKVANLLYQLRDEIAVDETLKGNLRDSFIKKRKPIWKRVWVYAVTAAIIFFAFFLRDSQPNPVEAHDFKVTNTLSLVSIGSGRVTAMAHYNGKMYLSLKNKGLFVNTKNEMKKISNSIADDLSTDSSGENLLFSANGSVASLNLNTNQKKILINSNSSVHYSHPVWKDNQTIYAAKDSGKKQEIVEFNLKTHKEKVLTNGKNPSYIEKTQMLVFERNGKIILRDKNGTEKLADNGAEPSVSLDGQYISYIKVSSGIEDVWVTDMVLKTKKMVTSNPDQNGYHYFQPVWSSTDRGLFVLKQQSAFKNGSLQIMKIDLGEKELDANQTVNRFLQALISRDDDYAKKIMKNPPEILTISNPHQTGYKILSTSEEKDGTTTHVQAEVTWSYTANPYYKLTTYDFKLIQGKNGYVISQVSELNSIELKPEINTNRILLIEGDKKEILFSLSDIPSKLVKASNSRIASLVFDPTGNKVYFTVQEIQDQSNQAAVNLFSYNINSKDFTFIDRIESIDGHNNIGISSMSLSGSGKYLAIDLYLDGPPFSAYVYVYDLKNNEQMKQFHQTHSLMWQDDQYYMQMTPDDQFMLLNRFDPTAKTK
jgi:hypothetical protein